MFLMEDQTYHHQVCVCVRVFVCVCVCVCVVMGSGRYTGSDQAVCYPDAVCNLVHILPG